MSHPKIETKHASRTQYIAAFIAIIILGLASRRYPWLFPPFLGKYPGDALWTLMATFGWGILRPAWPFRRLIVFGLLSSYIDELSQLYQAPWINSIRATRLGHWILGSTFSWLDMLAYTVGAAIAALAAMLLSRSKQTQRTRAEDVGPR